MKQLEHAIVREFLLHVWGKQACQRSEDWPRVLDSLLKPGVSSKAGESGRGSLEPLVNAAVLQLAQAFGNKVPADPALTVWRAFPKLDRVRCAELAKLLLEASGRELAPQPNRERRLSYRGSDCVQQALLTLGKSRSTSALSKAN